MSRPRIKIEIGTTDRIIEALAAIALVLILIITSYYYSELPDTIPQHYDLEGNPDRYGNKTLSLVLPGIGILMYIGLTILNLFPHVFNYPVKITEENAKKQYRLATRLLRTIKLVIVSMFAFITYASMKTAQGEFAGIGAYFLPTFIVIIFGVIGHYLYNSYLKKK